MSKHFFKQIVLTFLVSRRYVFVSLLSQTLSLHKWVKYLERIVTSVKGNLGYVSRLIKWLENYCQSKFRLRCSVCTSHKVMSELVYSDGCNGCLRCSGYSSHLLASIKSHSSGTLDLLTEYHCNLRDFTFPSSASWQKLKY